MNLARPRSARPPALRALLLVAATCGSPATAQEAGFTVRYKDEVSRYRVNAVSVLPRVALTISVEGSGPFTVRADSALLTTRGPTAWEWRAPEHPGLHAVTIASADPADTIRLNVFVLVPSDRVRNGVLNGYRIGTYPPPGRNSAGPPRGFIEVTPANRRTLVSPHFRLEQFLCKQESGWPRYVVLSERLLLKLEYLLAEVKAAGVSASTFHVMSGYRTPYYNRAIGNVSRSRHLWGEAADIFVDDRPRDGVMDDLNGDGRITVADAQRLYQLVETQVPRPRYARFLGGLGRYPATAAHGPFIHVDVRGYRARW